MAIREFVDGDGRIWQLWDTVPSTSSVTAATGPTARFLATGSRRSPEREAPTASHAAAPALFTAGREHGWLTFASDAEKRRLSPIPDHWQTASPAVLNELLARAKPVAFVSPFVVPRLPTADG
ncbi:MAG: hypothetical protein NVS4B3_08040 [Gemmatimonadaceae bacterium]